MLQYLLPFYEIWGWMQGENDTHGPPPWGFSNYFDDDANFAWLKTAPARESEAAPAASRYKELMQQTLQRFFEIITRSDLNVFEPLGKLLKAAHVAVLGLNGLSLRYVTLLTHCCNAVLLAKWLRLLSAAEGHNYYPSASPQQSRPAISNTTTITLRIGSWVVALLWALHPLHAEVLGWLSAQNYTFCLFFSLLSNIQLEKAVHAVRAAPGVHPHKHSLNVFWRSLAALSLYVAACCCKAPAPLSGVREA
jgi:hypothetical protein